MSLLIVPASFMHSLHKSYAPVDARLTLCSPCVCVCMCVHVCACAFCTHLVSYTSLQCVPVYACPSGLLCARKIHQQLSNWIHTGIDACSHLCQVKLHASVHAVMAELTCQCIQESIMYVVGKAHALAKAGTISSPVVACPCVFCHSAIIQSPVRMIGVDHQQRYRTYRKKQALFHADWRRFALHARCYRLSRAGRVSRQQH